MKNKKQDVNSLEELFKVVDAYSGWFANLADELSKVLANIQTSKEEEDTWEMKCSYEESDKVWIIDEYGEVDVFNWGSFAWKNDCFRQGNVFPTEEAAKLEAKRRNLLTRFRSFRDECNGNWKPDWENRNEYKYYIGFQYREIGAFTSYALNGLETFGHFKNIEDCEKAIELFGKEIKELFVECE